jgi:SAM-dependent methyltransferase
MAFNKSSETNIINLHLKNGTLDKYDFNKLQVNNQISLFSNLTSFMGKGHIQIGDTKKIKNYKMEYYFPLLEKIVNQIVIIYYDKFNKFSHQEKLDYQSNLESILIGLIIPRINGLIKGQILLSRLNPIIEKLIISGQISNLTSFLCESSHSACYLTFLYWLSKTKEKTINNLSLTTKKQIFNNSIGNSDDRIYKYILDNIIKEDKLFFQTNSSFMKDVFYVLANSLVPRKYILKRIKLFSTYISLIPYFDIMIQEFKDKEVLLELHKHYYVVPYKYEVLSKLINNIIQYEIITPDSIVLTDITNIYNILKTEEEKMMLNIILSTEYSIPDKKIKFNHYFDQIVFNNYTSICNKLHSSKFLSSINTNQINKNILNILSINNLLTKWIENNKSLISDFWIDENYKLLFFTRFLHLGKQKQNYKFKTIINVNKFLHLLRICVKRKIKNSKIERKVKMFDLLKEIKTFGPKITVPVLKNGSYVFQQQKQKFTNLPPRHLLPGEISLYDNFLLREKADGILINNLPVGIYPNVDIINNYQVKAEYIEELDLYLIFDIDIPNTTIIERYDILREAHPYTELTCLNQINNLDEFIQLFKKDRILLNKFMNENKSQPIKWYPKLACHYVKCNNNLHYNLINFLVENDKAVIDTIKSCDPFNCDGMIITPLSGDREIKIKPKSIMTIDLLYANNKWLDRELNDWSNVIIKSIKLKKEGKIYRCYPEIDSLPNLKFNIGEFRYDKKNPNPNHIVDNIINIIKYDWLKDIETLDSYYYGTNKKISSRKLIETINYQNDLLQQKIQDLEPSVNKNWLDLGCGRGKLIPLIKKFNPKKYLGIDADVKQLIRALKYHDENQNVYQFSPCNLANKWSETTYKWQSVNTNIKYDYVIANFSIMHFFTENFWLQLNEIVHEETKFLFNVVNVTSETKWEESESFLEVVGDVTKYRFEWTHDEVKNEQYINESKIEETIKSYGWKILNSQNINSKYPLMNMYKWFTIQKNQI